MIEFIYIIVMLAAFASFVTLFFYNNEWDEKMKYQDFVDDAKDGIENNFYSNNKYNYTYTQGLSVTKDENGELIIRSQSKLCGPSIRY